MPITITNVDLGSIFLQSFAIGFENDTLTVPANTTISEGTILARDSVSGNLVPFVTDGSTNENGIPKTVISYDVVNGTTSAVNQAVRVPVTAKVRAQRLIIQADGDNSNVTAAVKDQLRDFGIHPIAVDDESILDNQ